MNDFRRCREVTFSSYFQDNAFLYDDALVVTQYEVRCHRKITDSRNGKQSVLDWNFKPFDDQSEDFVKLVELLESYNTTVEMTDSTNRTSISLNYWQSNPKTIQLSKDLKDYNDKSLDNIVEAFLKVIPYNMPFPKSLGFKDEIVANEEKKASNNVLEELNTEELLVTIRKKFDDPKVEIKQIYKDHDMYYLFLVAHHEFESFPCVFVKYGKIVQFSWRNPDLQTATLVYKKR